MGFRASPTLDRRDVEWPKADFGVENADGGQGPGSYMSSYGLLLVCLPSKMLYQFSDRLERV